MHWLFNSIFGNTLNKYLRNFYKISKHPVLKRRLRHFILNRVTLKLFNNIILNNIARFGHKRAQRCTKFLSTTLYVFTTMYDIQQHQRIYKYTCIHLLSTIRGFKVNLTVTRWDALDDKLSNLLGNYYTNDNISFYRYIVKEYRKLFNLQQTRSLLTLSAKKRSLFVSLTMNGTCLFTLSTGMFYEDIYKHTISKKQRLELLEYRRGLKRKERKQYNRKRRVYNWKSIKHTEPNKLLMLRFAGQMLRYIYNTYLDIRLKGFCFNLLEYTTEVLYEVDDFGLICNLGDSVDLQNIYFSSIYVNKLTKRRLKRRLVKRICKYKSTSI